MQEAEPLPADAPFPGAASHPGRAEEVQLPGLGRVKEAATPGPPSGQWGGRKGGAALQSRRRYCVRSGSARTSEPGDAPVVKPKRTLC